MQADTNTQLLSKYPELDDPAFIARFDEAVKAEQAKFDAWMAEDRFEALIADAKAEAKRAYEAAAGQTEMDDGTSTWAEIDLGHRRAKPLVQALDNAGVGFIEINAWSWFINSDHVLGKRRRGKYGTARQNHAAVDAFAMALSRPGFELRISRE